MKKLIVKTGKNSEIILITTIITGLIALVIHNSIVYGIHSLPW
jgi:hypothetical protein